jgi:glycosyltransferase involved in cell wall biosynthesis
MRVLYFFENDWVFGKIFNELVKFLHPDIDGDVISWARLYSPDESAALRDKYDLYFSTPVGCFFLHEIYGWPLEKCYAHAHSEFDIADALKRYPRRYFDKLAGYGVVSAPIWNASAEAMIRRIPTILPVGVTTANYARPPSTKISKLGYFGRMSRADHNQHDLKRGHLARIVAEATGLELYHRENWHFLAADRLYREVDLVIFCSTTEGNPYMALEAAAAGVPVLGTPVGVFTALARMGCGIVLPMGAQEFVQAAVEAIQTLQLEPARYQHMAEMALRASQTFDWSVVKKLWLEELRSSCKTPEKSANQVPLTGLLTGV